MASIKLLLATLLIASSVSLAKSATAQNTPEETFTLNLKNADIHSLIETVSLHTGKNFIIDPRVKATVNVVSSEPVNASKLYDLFLGVLQVHGYAAVQAGNMIKIVPSSVGIQSAVPLVKQPSNASDNLVSRVIHLESMPALQVIETLGPLLSEPANLTAQGTGNTLIVTDTEANIKKLIELIKTIDNQ